MIKCKDGYHLNIQEQVEKNKDDILKLKKGYKGPELIAGTNIVLTPDEEEETLTIAATTEPVGSVSFENIIGDATDNESLANELDKKENILEAGKNVTIDRTDPEHPVINAQLGGGTVTDVQMDGTSIVDEDGVANITGVVKTTGDQVIDGDKTFKRGIKVGPNENRETEYANTAIYRTIDGSLITSYLPLTAGRLANEYDLEFAKLRDNPTDNTLLAAALAAKQNKLTAGANITIDDTDPDNPIISAIGGGSGVDIVLEAENGVVTTDNVWELFHNFFTAYNKVPSVVINDKKTEGASTYYEKYMFSFGEKAGDLETKHFESYQYDLDRGYGGSFHYNLRFEVRRDSRGPEYDLVEISTRDYDYQDKLTAGENISINQMTNVISAHVDWGTISGTLADQTDLKNALDGKQNVLTAGTNITIDTTDPAHPVISASGGSSSVDAKVIGIDMTLNPSTGAVTINSSNPYTEIVQYYTENNKYPVMIGIVHIATQPDIIIVCKDMVRNANGIIITGYATSFGSDTVDYKIIQINLTSAAQYATFSEAESLNTGAARLTSVDIVDNTMTIRDNDHQEHVYTPTFSMLPDAPDMTQYEMVGALDSDVTNLGFIKSSALAPYQTKVELDADVGALGYLKTVSWSDIPDAPTVPEIVANPAGAATDALNKLDINGTIYSINGIGGDVYFADILGNPTDNTALSAALGAKQNASTLDTDVSTLGYIKSSALDSYATITYVDSADDALDTRVTVNEGAIVSLSNGKQDKNTLDADVGDLGYLKSVSWSDIPDAPDVPSITANPVGEATDVLNKLDINGTIYTFSGSGTQVQSDWDQTDSTAVDFIKNKPIIPTVDVDKAYVDAGLAGKVGKNDSTQTLIFTMEDDTEVSVEVYTKEA